MVCNEKNAHDRFIVTDRVVFKRDNGNIITLETQPICSLFYTLNQIDITRPQPAGAQRTQFQFNEKLRNYQALAFMDADEINRATKYSSISIFRHKNWVVFFMPLCMTVFSGLLYIYYQRILYKTVGTDGSDFRKVFGSVSAWRAMTRITATIFWISLLFTSFVWYEMFVLKWLSPLDEARETTASRLFRVIRNAITTNMIPFLLIIIIIILFLSIIAMSSFRSKRQVVLFFINIGLLILLIAACVYVFYKGTSIWNRYIMYMLMFTILITSLILIKYSF